MFEQRYAILREDYANAGKASSAIKSALKQLGIAPDILRRIAVACYEAEINLIIHSYGGEILMSIDEENSKVILSFNDTGPGIPDMEKALTPGFSTARFLTTCGTDDRTPGGTKSSPPPGWPMSITLSKPFPAAMTW